MDDQSVSGALVRYKARRSAATMADGSRPYGWWKSHQRAISIPEVSQVDIERDAARMAKLQEEAPL